MDFPASGSALWGIYDATGIRPEWLLPVLYTESGLRPDVPNAQGYPYYGINQIAGSFLQSMGIAPSDYLNWPASRQLSTVVRPYYQGEVNRFGPIRSGIRVYQATFYPASLEYARGLDDVIVRAPSGAYEANILFDRARKGYITPRDLGYYVTKGAASAAVQTALSQTYALRPGETPEDSTYGEDFGTALPPIASKLLVAGTAALVAGSLVYAWNELKPRRAPRRANA